MMMSLGTEPEMSGKCTTRWNWLPPFIGGGDNCLSETNLRKLKCVSLSRQKFARSSFRIRKSGINSGQRPRSKTGTLRFEIRQLSKGIIRYRFFQAVVYCYNIYRNCRKFC